MEASASSLPACLQGHYAHEAALAHVHRGERWVATWRAPKQQGLLLEQERLARHHAWLFQSQLRRLGQPSPPRMAWHERGAWGLGALCALWGEEGIAASQAAWEEVRLEHLHAHRRVCLAAGDLAALACLEAVIADWEHVAPRSTPLSWRYHGVHRLVRMVARHTPL
jgi:demethoxyubiquinone hydroxylase (CLK1/Coq7/Cat5 family)